MSEDSGKPKRFRSPPYPMFDLGKAVERAKEMYAKANAHFVGVQVLAEAWGMKSADGKVWRTAASLIQYGLLQDSGTGKTRKFQLTDAAKRIILDTDPNSVKRREAINRAALIPMIHAELWGRFGRADGLSDTVIKTHLTIDREEFNEAPYSQGAAEEVIATYRASLDYAGLADSDKVDLQQEDTAENHTKDLSPPPSPKAKVGDFVQWIVNGVVQFEARKVDWVSDDGTFLRVFGSPTGIPMEQVEKVASPMSGQAPVVKTAPVIEQDDAKSGKLNATCYVENGRLKLTADVGLDEIEALRAMLEGYKTILKFMN
jgi:hypothetical protein